MPDLKNIEAAIALCKDEAKVLGLSFGTQNVTPGQHVPKEQAKQPPSLNFGNATGTYIVVCIDMDAPFPSFPVLPALHWIQSGLIAQPTSEGTTSLVSGSTPFIVDYAGPGPPPISAPHRYVFMLYEQPEGFDVAKFAPKGGKKVGIRPRMRYDVRVFEKAAGLGEVVGCNYFFSS